MDFQHAFGGLEPVPGAAAAVTRFTRAADAWRAAGGVVMHVRTFYTPNSGPGRLVDFAPGIAEALAEGAPMTRFYDGVVQDGDVIVRKTRFSAVLGGDIVDRLRELDRTTVVVGGLTTPICVQTTVDALQMTDHRVILLEDACASQPLGPISAEDAHRGAVERMRYVMARVIDTETFLAETAQHVASATAPA